MCRDVSARQGEQHGGIFKRADMRRHAKIFKLGAQVLKSICGFGLRPLAALVDAVLEDDVHPPRVQMCACGCPWLPHNHLRASGTTPCSWCEDCPAWRPARLSWWQVWRPRLRVPDSPAGLSIPMRRES